MRLRAHYVVGLILLAATVFTWLKPEVLLPPFGTLAAEIAPFILFGFAAWAVVTTSGYLLRGNTARAQQRRTPREFEEWVGSRFRGRGYRVQRIGGAHDGGVDLLVRRWWSTEVVQCKKYLHPVGPGPVRELIGTIKLRGAKKGHLVTTSRFTTAARTAAQGHRIELWDAERLDNL
jgi:hypothetical protein